MAGTKYAKYIPAAEYAAQGQRIVAENRYAEARDAIRLDVWGPPATPFWDELFESKFCRIPDGTSYRLEVNEGWSFNQWILDRVSR